MMYVCIYIYVSICLFLIYPKITWVRDFRFSSSTEHRMGLNSDDLPSIDAWRGTVTDALLIPLEISWSLEQSKICEILGGEIHRNPNPWPNSGRGGFRVQSESGTSSPQAARLWNLGTWWCCTMIVPSFHRISRTGSKHNCRILQQNVGISRESPNTKVLDILEVKNVLGSTTVC